MFLLFAKLVRPVAPSAAPQAAASLVRLALLASLVLTLGVSGCGGGGGGGGGGGRSATVVRGKVFDAANGDLPLQGATITLGGVTTTTRTVDNSDADQNLTGSFEINNPTAGSTTAVITPVGQAPQTVAFEPGVQSNTERELELYINIGQVRGRALLPDGSPASNGFVTITTATNSETIPTNADGSFLASLVLPGETAIAINQGTAAVTRTVTVGNGLTELGDITLVEDPNSGTPPALPNTITGRVAITGGALVAGSNVILTRDGIQIESTVTNAEGKYSFYVPIGNYGLRVLRNGFNVYEREGVIVSNTSTPLDVETITLTEVQ